MLRLMSYAHVTTITVIIFLRLLPTTTSLLLPEEYHALTANNNTWSHFARFLDLDKGSEVSGISDLKTYFQRFGYIEKNDKNFSDIFDDELELTLLRYQKKLGLAQTGKLDYDTISLIVSPRCGMADDYFSFSSTKTDDNINNYIHLTRRFAYFPGEPRWSSKSSPLMLTYAFSNTIGYVGEQDIRAAFRSAFSRWSAVIPVNFTEAGSYSTADVKIGWYSLDHGDGESFDGVLGVLAHAFSPESGRLHLDAAERWAVDFGTEKSKDAVDLESVATHEIGHVLGLAHSSIKEAVMFPSLSPRTKKVDLTMDDVAGVQRLYGESAGFNDSKLGQSYTSEGCCVRVLLFRVVMSLALVIVTMIFLMVV